MTSRLFGRGKVEDETDTKGTKVKAAGTQTQGTQTEEGERYHTSSPRQY